MKQYQKLKKGRTYSVFYRGRLFRGIYKKRWYNSEIGKWHYSFQSLDGFSQFTPIAQEIQIFFI